MNLLVAALLLAPPPTQDAFEVSDERLDELARSARSSVETALEAELEGLTFRRATADEIADVLRVEMTPQFRAQIEDAEEADEARDDFLAVYAPALLAKYAPEQDLVMVSIEGFERQAELLDYPELMSEDVLRAVLVHEAVHALDHRTHDWDERLATLGSTDAIHAFNAVLEGHAQFRARSVCAANGWSEPFETFTRAISMTPSTGDAAIDYSIRAQAVLASFAYVEGEKFIAAIHTKGGDEAVARAFAEPPTDPEVIIHPGWYLDPSSRPETVYDIEASLSEFLEGFDEETWNHLEMGMMRTQIEQALGLLDEAAVERAMRGFLECRMANAMHKASEPGERLASAAIFEMDSEASAADMLAAEEALLKKKDETFREGDIRIVEVEYEEVEAGPARGLYSRKVIEAFGDEMHIWTVILKRGPLVCEMTFIGEERGKDELLALAASLLEPRLLEKEDGKTEEDETER